MEEINFDDIEDPIVTRLDLKRTDIRTRIPIVKNARQDLNAKTRSYRLLCETLREGRRSVIVKAVRDFRLAHKAQFKASAELVAESLARVERIEMAELAKVAPVSEVKVYLEHVKPYDYDPIEHMRCKDDFAADPLTEKFWRM